MKSAWISENPVSAFQKAHAAIKGENPILPEAVISWVKCANDVETSDISLIEVFALISAAFKIREQIQQIRNRFEAEMALSGDREKAKRIVEPLKKQLPGVTWSGTFSRRAS